MTYLVNSVYILRTWLSKADQKITWVRCVDLKRYFCRRFLSERVVSKRQKDEMATTSSNSETVGNSGTMTRTALSIRAGLNNGANEIQVKLVWW